MYEIFATFLQLHDFQDLSKNPRLLQIEVCLKIQNIYLILYILFAIVSLKKIF